MKIIVFELVPGKWAIKQVSSVGVSAGRTTYASSEEALTAAKVQFPDKEIEVENRD